VIEIGWEHSITFQDYEYALYNNHSSPAWFLIVADLRRDETFTLERVYPRPEDLPERTDDGEYHESTLHFFSKDQGKMIEEAMTNPNREAITAKELPRPTEPWYVC